MAWGAMRKSEGGSGVLDRPFKLWSLIIDSVQCRGGLQRRKPDPVPEPKKHPGSGSDRLSELLKQREWWETGEEEGVEIRKKEKVLEDLKKVAKKLQHQEQDDGGSMAQVLEAAAEVRLLTKDDPHARTTLALLGVIPPLVGLLDRPDPSFAFQISALYALLNLAIANDANKSAVVKAGAVHKMLNLIHSPDDDSTPQNQAVAEAVVANFLGLSALDSNKPIIGSSGAIPFLVHTLKDSDKNLYFSLQAKQDAMRALYNLSISPSNVYILLETDLIADLFAKLGDMDTSERILAIISNVVCVAEGRKRVSTVPDVFPILIDILNWADSSGCQEKACYILMVMAHKSYSDRQAMMEAGIVSALLELTLVGSTLAQKRASRMLEFMRGGEKGKQICGGGSSSSAITLSAPLSKEGVDVGQEEEKEDGMMSQEKKAVRQLVQQSLHNNMKRMVTRANLPHDINASELHHLKVLAPSSTSKSLPF